MLLPWAKPAGGEEDEFDMGGGGPPQAPVGGMRQPTALPGRPPPSVRVSSLTLFLLDPLEIKSQTTHFCRSATTKQYPMHVVYKE